MPISRYTMNKSDDLAQAGLEILAEGDTCGVGMVRDPRNGDLFVFNHLEYDAGTLGKEYHRDEKAGLNTAIPENYFPQNDPSQAPINSWRPFAFLLMANWINDLYQDTLYDLSTLGDTADSVGHMQC